MTKRKLESIAVNSYVTFKGDEAPRRKYKVLHVTFDTRRQENILTYTNADGSPRWAYYAQVARVFK